MNDKTKSTVKQLAQELLDKLEVAATVTIDERDQALWVIVDTAEPGVLIGYHGRSLEAIQIILGQMCYKKLGEWQRLVVTVGDYRERREKQVKDLAQNAATRAVESNEPVIISDLTPAERRIVHLELAANPQVTSESEGEGRQRILVVKPKS